MLNGCSSEGNDSMKALLRPILFLININYICNGVSSEYFLFAYDSNPFKDTHNPLVKLVREINDDLQRITNCHVALLVSQRISYHSYSLYFFTY